MARDALPAYPAWMPIPRKDDYSYDPEDRRVTTDTEVAQIRRPEYATDETVVQCSVMLSPLECAFFESFEHDILAQGSGWFSLPLLLSGQVSEHEACFASRPKFGKLHGCHITVTMELRLKSRNRMCPQLTSLLTEMGPPDIFRLHDALAACVGTFPNSELPYYWQHACRQKEIAYGYGL